MDRNKGNSIIDALLDYVVVDIETTGLDPRYDKIIEVGAIRVRGGESADSYSSLIDPMVPIEPFIEWKTGITTDMVSGAPPAEQIIPQLLEFIGNDVIVGHNVNFDINFLYDLSIAISGNPVSNDFVDTMRLARLLHKDMKHCRLPDCLSLYGLSADTSHRALADCASTLAVYKAESAELLDKGIPPLKRSSSKMSLKNITAMTVSIDEDGPIYGKVFVFTGALDRMIRKDAAQLVVNAGGLCGDSVTKKTNFLVLGNNDYCSTIKDGKSLKQKKAEELIKKGADLTILSEDAFYDMIFE